MLFKSYLTFTLIKLLSLTFRFKYLNREKVEDTKKRAIYNNYLYSIWHQNLIGAILSETTVSHAVIVSSSKDGELVANTCKRLGHSTARGSSSKGGGSALKKMIKLLKANTPGAITVDGPRGPAKVPKLGIFELSYLSQTPIIPLTVIPTSYWVFKNSWDQFRLPKPFSTFYVHYGDAIFVDKNSKENGFSKEISNLTHQMKQSEDQINSILSSI